MIKRLLLVLALGTAFAACSPANSSTSPDVANPASMAPASIAPASMAPSIDVSPSP